MSRPTERDLVDLLRTDARDVCGPDHLVLDVPSPARRPRAVVAGAAVALLAVAVLLAVEFVVLSVAGPAGRTAAPPAAADVSLAPSREYTVSATTVLTDRQVLSVTFQPGPYNVYEGGTITLYEKGAFRAVSFTTSAERLSVAGHAGYFGKYDHQHVLAWPVPDGRWLAVAGFNGVLDGVHPREILRAALAVAPLVRVA